MVKTTENSGSGRWHDVGGGIFLFVSFLFLMSMVSYHPFDISLFSSPVNDPPHNLVGKLGAQIAFIFFMLFGIGAYLLPIILAALGLLCLFHYEGRKSGKAGWMILAMLAGVCMLELIPEKTESLITSMNINSAGGIFGELVGQRFLIFLVGKVGAFIFLTGLLWICLVALLEVKILQLFKKFSTGFLALSAFLKTRISSLLRDKQEAREEQRALEESRDRLREAARKKESGRSNARKAPTKRVPKKNSPIPKQTNRIPR